MDDKNLGVLIAPPRPKDFLLGSATSINAQRLVHDWSIYLPALESQRNKITDFLDCVTLSALHSIEMQLNYLLQTSQLSDEALIFFHNNNYIVDGSFELSPRFNAKLNGTEELKGQYLNMAGDCIRRDGLLPRSDWPVEDEMSWVEFYSMIPVGLFAKAKKALWFVDIKYQWLDKVNFPTILPISPIQIASEVCAGWDSGQVVPKCSGQALQHATVIYGNDPSGNWLDLDHYPPFKQVLDKDYEFPANIQYIVTPKPITLRNGMTGKNVLQLQQELNKLGFRLTEDSIFGKVTELAVTNIQNKTGLKPDGIAGPLTLTKIKTLTAPKSILDVLIQVESGGDDMAEGDKTLTNHAYGCLQIRQGVCDAVNEKFGTNYKAENCLGHRQVSLDIWEKYWQVFPLIVTDEDKARSWNGGPAWKKIYYADNKTPAQINYCNNLDTYWSKVKKLLNS